MKDINDIELRRLDLTLLMVLDGALRHRKLTTVADQLGLTQPAISHAVTRLRDILGDPLFVRRANGVQPTPRALALAQPVAQALATLRDALQQGRCFDPSCATREFRVAALDYAIAMLVPDFLARFSTIAPGCRLAFRSMGYEAGRTALASGSIDLILGIPAPSGPFLQRTLMTEDFVVLARPHHPVVGRKLDLARYLKCGHLLVSAAGDARGTVDNALVKIGKERRVVAAVPQFLAGFAAVAGSDMITTAPRRLAKRHAAAFGLKQYEVPFPLAGFEVATLRHENTAQDAGLTWLENELAQALGRVR
ncbi:LysR family transcriptional regulator [Dongia deserti]|uniref:LysR family transcriptional regulator n=1 Tax=Dongia deserti TaxID=2268030 RepID=UPI000E652007|nr:LysR family transcriptional regulator [Dongia deserti]